MKTHVEPRWLPLRRRGNVKERQPTRVVYRKRLSFIGFFKTIRSAILACEAETRFASGESEILRIVDVGNNAHALSGAILGKRTILRSTPSMIDFMWSFHNNSAGRTSRA